jgi:hypothetical protein
MAVVNYWRIRRRRQRHRLLSTRIMRKTAATPITRMGTPCGTRTRNLRNRGPTPCPLCQGGCYFCCKPRGLKLRRRGRWRERDNVLRASLQRAGAVAERFWRRWHGVLLAMKASSRRIERGLPMASRFPLVCCSSFQRLQRRRNPGGRKGWNNKENQKSSRGKRNIIDADSSPRIHICIVRVHGSRRSLCASASARRDLKERARERQTSKGSTTQGRGVGGRRL